MRGNIIFAEREPVFDCDSLEFLFVNLKFRKLLFLANTSSQMNAMMAMTLLFGHYKKLNI